MELIFQNKDKKSTGFKIIEIFIKNKNSEGLLNSEIQNILIKEYKLKISFQGVRKVLNKLVEDKNLIKLEKYYKINEKWIKEMSDFFSSFNSVRNNVELKLKDKTGTKLISFDNYSDMAWFFYDLFDKNFFDFNFKDENDEVCIITDHIWFPIVETKLRTNILNIMKKTKVKMLITNYSLLDKFIVFWAKNSVSYKKLKNHKNVYHSIITDSCVIQFHFEKNLKDKMNELYSFKIFPRFNIFEKMLDMFYTKNKIVVTVNYDKELAKAHKEAFYLKFK